MAALLVAISQLASLFGLLRLTPRAPAPKALPGHTGMISENSQLDVFLEGITSAESTCEAVAAGSFSPPWL